MANLVVRTGECVARDVKEITRLLRRRVRIVHPAVGANVLLEIAFAGVPLGAEEEHVLAKVGEAREGLGVAHRAHLVRQRSNVLVGFRESSV